MPVIKIHLLTTLASSSPCQPAGKLVVKNDS